MIFAVLPRFGVTSQCKRQPYMHNRQNWQLSVVNFIITLLNDGRFSKICCFLIKSLVKLIRGGVIQCIIERTDILVR